MTTVLVTGANRGIGLEFVRQYCDMGYRVIATCRSPSCAIELINIKKKFDKKLHIIQMDVSDEFSVAEASKNSPVPSIDIVINNAGTGASETGIESIDFDAMQNVFKTNAMGPLCVTKYYLKQLTQSGNPVIVNLISGLGFLRKNKTYPENGSYSYSTSKCALNLFTKILAGDLRSKNIIVIGVGPGYVLTDMTRGGDWSPTLTPRETVPHIIQKIRTLSIDDTGELFDYDEKTSKVVPAFY